MTLPELPPGFDDDYVPLADAPSRIRCDACSAEYDVTEEYLAENAGSSFQCACGRFVALPATPDAGRNGPWRDGGHIVVTPISPMPCNCIRCNEPIPRIFEHHLRWQPIGGLAIAVIAGASMLATLRVACCAVVLCLLVGIFLALGHARTFPVRYGYCESHRPFMSARAFSFVLAVLALALFELGLFTFAAFGRSRQMLRLGPLIGSALSFAAAILVSAWPGTLRIVKIKDGRAWLAGFSESYLAALPSLPPALRRDQP